MSSVHTEETEVPAAPKRAHFPGFDGLRAIAALAVVVAHAASWTGLDTKATAVGPYLARAGQFGVAVFFVISGFLLYRPFAASHLTGRTPPATRPFYRRRLFRIFPAYWVALTAFLFIADQAAAGSTKEIVQQYLLLQVYDAETVLDGLPQAWSLCVEISFYLLLPAIAFGVVRVGRRVGSPLSAELGAVAALYAFAVVFRAAVLAFAPSLQSPTFLWLLGTVDWFALGMAGAVLSAAADTGRPLPRVVAFLARRPAVSWLFAAELYWILVQLDLPAGFVPPTASQHMGKHLLLGAAAALLAAPAAFRTRRPSAVRSVLEAWPLRRVGVVSYSVFLWHVLWIRTVAEWLDIPQRAGGFWTLLLATLAITIPWAAASYWLVERPTMELGQRPAQPAPITPAPAPAPG